MYRRSGLFVGNRYGSGSGPIWHEYLYCADNVVSLFQCAIGFWNRQFYGCGHDEDVSIVCDDGIGKLNLSSTDGSIVPRLSFVHHHFK